jgi:hypothetical protein
MQLNEPLVCALLRALQPMRGQVPGELGQLLRKVQEKVSRLHPSLAPLVAVSAGGTLLKVNLVKRLS